MYQHTASLEFVWSPASKLWRLGQRHISAQSYSLPFLPVDYDGPLRTEDLAALAGLVRSEMESWLPF